MGQKILEFSKRIGKGVGYTLLFSFALLAGLSTCVFDMAKTAVGMKMLFGERRGTLSTQEGCEEIAHEVGMMVWPIIQESDFLETDVLNHIRWVRELQKEKALNHDIDINYSKYDEFTENVYVVVGEEIILNHQNGKTRKHAIKNASDYCVWHIRRMVENQNQGTTKKRIST